MFTAIISSHVVAAGIKEVSVAEVRHSLDAQDLIVVDANTTGVRKSEGVLPGAIKLSSFDQYALTELPADKRAQLVFYCYSPQCTASDVAAERAIHAGYQNVRVLRAGITGWNAAQQSK